MAGMADKLSRVVRGHAPSLIREMFQRAARYENVISLGIGDPDFDTPEPVCRAALNDALAGHTHYTQSQGDPELLSALAADLNRRYGFGCAPSDIVVTFGGMGALAAAFRALLDDGDQVIIPEPFFPDYTSHVEFSGGVCVFAPTEVANGFAPDPAVVESRVTPRTKVLLVNTPCNPTGAVIPGPVLDALAELAIRRDLVVISDEVYDRLTFGVAHESIRTRPGMAERTLVIGSFSKNFAMTGWRIGWALGPEWLVRAILNVTTHNTSCPNSVSQRAAIAALAQPQETWEAMRREFAARCALVHERLAAMPGVSVAPPRGSFYIFPRIARIGGDGRRFALELLDREQVVVVPGEAFGPSGTGCVRLACTVGQERLAEAMDRLERFLAGYRG